MSHSVEIPPPLFVPLFARPPRSIWREYGRPALLFVVTAASVFLHGALSVDDAGFLIIGSWEDGLVLAGAVFAIMIAHEMGHYLACRRYGVDATLPHFLPAPPIVLPWLQPVILSLVGTFGAFIRIRGPFPNRRALFDIGVAGPLAGFAVTVVVLALAIGTVHLVPMEGDLPEPLLNFPLLFQVAERFVRLPAEIPDGMRPTASQPLLLAAWFGAFLTALNLFPIGQLDGGHVTYALLRDKALRVSRVAFWACASLVLLSPSWILWTVLVGLIGRRHPFTLDDDAAVGRGRAAVGLLAVAVFVLCFTPSPFSVGWHDFYMMLTGSTSTETPPHLSSP